MANAAYLIANTLSEAAAIVRLVAKRMRAEFGAFLVLDFGELARDQLAADTPYLAPFEISVSASPDAAAERAQSAFVGAVEKIEGRYRAPRIERPSLADDPHAGLARRLPDIPTLTVRVAPIYRVPTSRAVYPELQGRLVTHLVDAGLRAASRFARTETALAPATHRALGRRVFIEAVTHADRAMDDIAASFDFLLAVTPINADAAFEEFHDDVIAIVVLHHVVDADDAAMRQLRQGLAFGQEALFRVAAIADLPLQDLDGDFAVE